MRPRREQILSHLLFKVASICDESCRQQTVSSNGGHLVLEGFTGLLPTVPFSRQTFQESCTAIHLQENNKFKKRCPTDATGEKKATEHHFNDHLP